MAVTNQKLDSRLARVEREIAGDDQFPGVRGAILKLQSDVRWIKLLCVGAVASNLLGALGGPSPAKQAAIFIGLF